MCLVKNQSEPCELLGQTIIPQHIHCEGSSQNNLESLLNYIELTPEHLENADVLTDRSVLQRVAQHGDVSVQALRHKGKLFVRFDEESQFPCSGSNEERNIAIGKAVERLFIQNPHPNGTVDTNVLDLEIPTTTDPLRVCYSSELDCYDGLEDQNIEIEATTLSLNEWMRWKSCETYWKCLLGNVQKIILVLIGEDDVVVSVHTFTPDDLVERGKGLFVEGGIRRLSEFATVLRQHLKNDGDAVVLSRVDEQENENMWKDTTMQEVSNQFKDLVAKL